MRENVLRDLASRAATDARFLRQARRDLEGTLAGYGYDLTLEELRLVEDLRRRTTGTGNLPVRLPVASEDVPAALQHDPEVDGGGSA